MQVDKSGHQNAILYTESGGAIMKRIPQGRYSKEFREEVAKLVIYQELRIPKARRHLDITKSTISNWVRAKKGREVGNNR